MIKLSLIKSLFSISQSESNTDIKSLREDIGMGANAQILNISVA